MRTPETEAKESGSFGPPRLPLERQQIIHQIIQLFITKLALVGWHDGAAVDTEVLKRATRECLEATGEIEDLDCVGVLVHDEAGVRGSVPGNYLGYPKILRDVAVGVENRLAKMGNGAL